MGYIASLNFGCYYSQYVPASEPFDHAWFEVLEVITLYCSADKTKYMVMSRDQNAGRNHSVRIDNSTFERVEEFKYLGTTLTNQNSILEEMKSRLRSGNACYHSVQNLLSSRFNQSIHWHVQNAVIPCRSQEPLPFLPVIHFFLSLLSADHSSILPHFIEPCVSWSNCFQIHIQYSFVNSVFFHSLYMSKPS